MEIKIVKKEELITKEELKQMAEQAFGNLVKAVVDVEQEIMAVGGEFHADEEVLLMEREKSKREHTWGINLRFDKAGEDWIEFDSIINLKPVFGNRTRGIDDQKTKEKIIKIVNELVKE